MDRKSFGTLAATLAVTHFVLAAMASAQHATSRVSVSSAGVEGDKASARFNRPVVSGDGRHVAFESDATNLVRNDRNNASDVFVHDRKRNKTTRVSVSSSGAQANGSSTHPSITQDGRFVAFQSTASNLSTNNVITSVDVFVHDRDPDLNGIFDEGNGTTVCASVDSAELGAFGGDSDSPSISADGSRVAFASNAFTLVVGDTNGARDVFIRDLAAGITFRVSVKSGGAQSLFGADLPEISADGTVVTMETGGFDLAPDADFFNDVFLHDTKTGLTEVVNLSSSGVDANDNSFSGHPNGDGTKVTFMSTATNLVSGDRNGSADIYVRDRSAGTCVRASISSAGTEANGNCDSPWISTDGTKVAFESVADNLVPFDANGLSDVFVHDLLTGTTTIASGDCVGNSASGGSFDPSLSDDGVVTAFSSLANDLVANDTNAVRDAFVHDADDEIDATWSSYGTGFPGTLGVPSLTASADPVIDTYITIDVGNSLGLWTMGFVFAGLSEASLPSSLGGTLLVGDLLVVLPIAVSQIVTPLPLTIPRDPALCGFVLFVQVLELDDGAVDGVSFTPGLELVFGH